MTDSSRSSESVDTALLESLKKSGIGEQGE